MGWGKRASLSLQKPLKQSVLESFPSQLDSSQFTPTSKPQPTEPSSPYSFLAVSFKNTGNLHSQF